MKPPNQGATVNNTQDIKQTARRTSTALSPGDEGGGGMNSSQTNLTAGLPLVGYCQPAVLGKGELCVRAGFRAEGGRGRRGERLTMSSRLNQDTGFPPTGSTEFNSIHKLHVLSKCFQNGFSLKQWHRTDNRETSKGTSTGPRREAFARESRPDVFPEALKVH